MNRFEILYDEQGGQLHNDYIGAIAARIEEYYRRQGIKLDNPSHIYGLIHRDENLLETWENILEKQGLL